MHRLQTRVALLSGPPLRASPAWCSAPAAAIRPDPARKSAVQYRLYCALHSAAQQARDEKVWAERQEKAAAQQQKESKTKQAERLAAARQELAKQEADRTNLHYRRANLETCRCAPAALLGCWVVFFRTGYAGAHCQGCGCLLFCQPPQPPSRRLPTCPALLPCCPAAAGC